jgi:hypothetical protein
LIIWLYLNPSATSFDLQNLQFLLGAESCFVDTCQLVVIQLPVQISELKNLRCGRQHSQQATKGEKTTK